MGGRWTSWLTIACLAPLAACATDDRAPPPTTRAGAPVDLTEGLWAEAEQPAPAWQARPAEANAVAVPGTSYTVRPGDTLSGIAERSGAGLQAIARANALEPPYLIRADQALTIPAGRYHQIARGETGIAIARAYGVEWSEVVALNGFEEPFLLRAGERILLPSAAEARSMSRAERAAAFRIDIDDIITGGEPALAQGEAPARPAPTPARTLPATAAVSVPADFSGRFVWPATGPVIGGFGAGQSGVRNQGIDIGVERGAPVVAAGEGVVIYVGEDVAVHGGLVLINHGEGWITAYSHVERVRVARGQRVARGEAIALAGDTGIGDRPRLHFEIRRDRAPVDPIAHLPRPRA